MYNSTAHCLDTDGNVLSTCVVELDDEGRVLRSNAVQCTGLEGTPAYQDRFDENCARLRGFASVLFVPGTAGYREQIGPDAVERFDPETGEVLRRRASRSRLDFFEPETKAALDRLAEEEAEAIVREIA